MLDAFMISYQTTHTYPLSFSLPLPSLRLFFLPRPRALLGPECSVAEGLTRHAWSCQPYQLYTAASENHKWLLTTMQRFQNSLNSLYNHYLGCHTMLEKSIAWQFKIMATNIPHLQFSSIQLLNLKKYCFYSSCLALHFATLHQTFLEKNDHVGNAYNHCQLP